jgi:hypothetical protein
VKKKRERRPRVEEYLLLKPSQSAAAVNGLPLPFLVGGRLRVLFFHLTHYNTARSTMTFPRVARSCGQKDKRPPHWAHHGLLPKRGGILVPSFGPSRRGVTNDVSGEGVRGHRLDRDWRGVSVGAGLVCMCMASC